MYIPLRIRLLHNFGRSSFNIGFIFGLIGLAFVVFFSFKLNWKILMAEDNDFGPAQAYITQYDTTAYSVNDIQLFEYQYSYSISEENQNSGSFLEYPEVYKVGELIQIEYLIDSPEISRISGKDRRNYNQIMFLAGIGGLIVGIIFLYTSIRKTKTERQILMAGLPAMGKLIHAEPTNLQVNEQTVYKLIYEYSTGSNKLQQFTIRSHMIRNLSEDHSEMIIYDPRNPTSPIIVETLPGPVARYVSQKLEKSQN